MIGIIFALQVIRTDELKLLPAKEAFRLLSAAMVLSIFIEISWIAIEVHVMEYILVLNYMMIIYHLIVLVVQRRSGKDAQKNCDHI